MNKKIKLVSILCLAGIWSGISLVLLFVAMISVGTIFEYNWFNYFIFPSLTALWLGSYIIHTNEDLTQLFLFAYIGGFLVSFVMIYAVSFLLRILKILIVKLKFF